MSYIIFPNQLFYDKKYLQSIKKYQIYLIEEPRFFTDFKYHKLKLLYSRATMKKYYDYLIKNNFDVKYIDFDKVNDSFYTVLKKVIFVNVADFKLTNKIIKLLGEDNVTILEHVNFLIKMTELYDIKELIYKNNKYSQDVFYKYQRRKLDILMDGDKPVGGKWSYDKMNRLPLPKNIIIPKLKTKIKDNDEYINEAKSYVMKHFNSNYGSCENMIYPLTYKDSIIWLKKFLKERLIYFGKYEDAVDNNYDFIFHSVLSPMMNIGIITDTMVIKFSNNYYLKNKNRIPLESYEGFIRQIIGWRNYVLCIYYFEGETMRNNNYLNHNNKINNNIYKKLWTATTNILPIDNIIQKIIRISYAHHIERLMYIGNFLLLCKIRPKDVYRMFMEWTIDAYDWVMVPNVFGMSTYSDGGMMMTRPYFSSSKYILRMSNYKKDKWCEIWDILYYNFIYSHQDILRKNYATAMQVKHWDNKKPNEKKDIIKKAQHFIENWNFE